MRRWGDGSHSDRIILYLICNVDSREFSRLRSQPNYREQRTVPAMVINEMVKICRDRVPTADSRARNQLGRRQQHEIGPYPTGLPSGGRNIDEADASTFLDTSETASTGSVSVGHVFWDLPKDVRIRVRRRSFVTYPVQIPGRRSIPKHSTFLVPQSTKHGYSRISGYLTRNACRRRANISRSITVTPPGSVRSGHSSGRPRNDPYAE